MEEKVIKVNDKKICYRIRRRKGPVIIFIHGATGSLSALRWLVSSFRKDDFTLILIDLGGHGFSFRAGNYQDLLIESQVSYLKKILAKENLNEVILVGHCFGSMVAATFAALEGEKVIKLVLISPGFGLPPWLSFLKKSHLFKRMIDFVSKISSSKGIFDKRLNYQKFRNTGDFYLPRIISDLKHMSFKTAFTQFRAVLEWRGEKYFKMINAPTLIIAGKRDKISPPGDALGIKNLIRGAKIKLFAEADHVPVLNIPEKVAWEILNFVKEG